MDGFGLDVVSVANRLLQSDSWTLAKEAWAADLGCGEIDEGSTSQFARIWVNCIVGGATIVACVTVPFYWCNDWSHEPVTVEPPIDDKEDGTPETSPHAKPPRLADSVSKEMDPVPNLENAIQHLKETSPTVNGRWRRLHTNATELNEVGGLGVELYFRLLQALGFCFCYMSVFIMPLMVFSWNGNFAVDIGGSFAKTTAANLGNLVEVSGVAQEARLAIIGCQGVLVTKLTEWFGWLDWVTMVIFTFFVVYFRFVTVPKVTAEMDEHCVTVSDFAVEIDGLPERIDDHKNYEELLRAHLEERIGSSTSPAVRELSIIRDFDQRLGSVKRRLNLMFEKSVAEYKGDVKSQASLQKKIDVITAKLAKNVGPEDELSVVRAYAILNSEADVRQLRFQYRFANYAICRFCQRRVNMFQGGRLRVQPAPEPTDIIWVNQDTGWRERALRSAIAFSVWFLIMAVSAALVGILRLFADDLQTGVSNIQLGSDTCDAGTEASGQPCNSLEMVLVTASAARNFSGDSLQCWCITQGYTEVLRDRNLRDICADWLQEDGKNSAIAVLTAVVVVSINVILQVFTKEMAEWQRPISESGLNASIVYRLFVAQYINTAVVTSLISADVWPFEGPYSDFERGWYSIVGVPIITALMFNVVSGSASTLGKWAFICFKRTFCWRRHKHQAELLKLYTNPKFEIAQVYARVLSTVFVTLTYSSGLPLVNLFAILYFFANYWVDKAVLLWGSRRPPAFDARIPMQAATILLYAGPIHMFVALFMFSHGCTFPSDELGESLSSDSGQLSNNFGNRLVRQSTWMIFASLVLLIALWAVWVVLQIVGATFGEFFRLLHVCCCSRRPKTTPVEDGPLEVTWDTAVEQIRKRQPQISYQFKNDPEFRVLYENTTDKPPPDGVA